MTQVAMLAEALLNGETVSIKNAYFEFGMSNIAREMGRSIERKFGVKVERERCEGYHRGGGKVFWFEYRLRRSKENMAGVKRMVKYVHAQKNCQKLHP